MIDLKINKTQDISFQRTNKPSSHCQIQQIEKWIVKYIIKYPSYINIKVLHHYHWNNMKCWNWIPFMSHCMQNPIELDFYIQRNNIMLNIKIQIPNRNLFLDIPKLIVACK